MAGQIDIFILMAGVGTRFRRDGYDVPKPLIKFKEQPLFVWAMKSVKELLPQANLHLVICAEDNIQDKVELALTNLPDLRLHTVHIIAVPKRTAGPLDTAVQAVRQTAVHDRTKPIIFCDCDLYFESTKWIDAVKQFMSGPANEDALLVSFESEAEKYSFVKIDESGYAAEVAEKKVISKNAIAGFYAFKEAKTFLQTGNKVLDGYAAVSNEHFISQVYNELIHSGKKVKVFKADKVVSLGTPEEVEASGKLDI
ncbi:MAG: hypothetical protein K0R29_2563 [Pseudobdellovibrio sp.]|nr:hypothetical protein [Pseudobdellovibrio sp.]